MDLSKVLPSKLYSLLDSDERNRLSLLLDRTVTGSDAILLSPIGERIDPNVILDGWDKIFNSKTQQMNDVLLKIEANQRSKYGPRSIAKPWSDRVDGLKNSFIRNTNVTVHGEVSSFAPIKGTLRPLSLENAAKYLKSTTSSGLPFMVKKGLVIDYVLKNFESLKNLQLPAVLFTRTQESLKTRTVWGVDIATVLNEMRFYRPLLEIQKKQSWRAALRDADSMDTAITNLIQYAREKDLYLVSIDFITYDDTVKRNIQKVGFDYVKVVFQPKYGPSIDEIARRFATVAIVTPDGVFEGEHGIPSGSVFTNEIGSTSQYGLVKLEGFDTNYAQVQGDDGAYASEDPEALLDMFQSYGLKPNYDKSDVSKDYIVFLQNLYHIDYIRDGKIKGIYPTYRALLRLVYLERFENFTEFGISGKDYFAIRTLSILENVKNHPLFPELVNYVLTLDKYSLIPSDQGIAQYVKMKAIKDGKDVNFSSHTYSESSGIKDFASYKLVRDLTV